MPKEIIKETRHEIAAAPYIIYTFHLMQKKVPDCRDLNIQFIRPGIIQK